MKNELVTRSLSNHEFDLWDKFVISSPQGTVFHNSKWITTSAKALGVSCELVGVFDENGGMMAGVPIFYNKKYGIPYITSSLPLSPASGFMLSDYLSGKGRRYEEMAHSYLNSIRIYLENKKGIFTIIQNYPEMRDVRPFVWNDWRSKVNYRYQLNLNCENWQFSKGVRRSFNKAKKEGITISVEYLPEEYWELNVDTYQKQGLAVPFSKRYLTSLMDVAINSNMGEMWVAKSQDNNIASAEFVLWDNRVVHRWSCASYSKYNGTGATSLLLYTVFTEMYSRGYDTMNLMAANTPHLAKFVSGFSPSLVPYYSVYRMKRPLNFIQKLL